MSRETELNIKQEPTDQPATVNSHNDNRKKYTCETCEITVFSRSGIRRHFRHKHLGLGSSAQDKTEVCNICGAYVTKRNFKDHVSSHSTARNFKCEFCGSAVKSIYTLRKHIKRVHMIIGSSTVQGTMKTNCEICRKDFPSIAAYRRHELRWHNDTGNVTCEVCGKKSLTIGEHNYHMKIHSTDKKFKCEFCKLRFASTESLKVHQIKHKSEWSYECGMCSKVFKHSSSVSGHRRTHKVNGFYCCGCCDERFNDYGQLKIHFINSGHSFCSKETD